MTSKISTDNFLKKLFNHGVCLKIVECKDMIVAIKRYKNTIKIIQN